jgi:hypothetical protein
MTEQRITTKAALLPEIERQWTALQAALGLLSEAQMTSLYDTQGWNVKDHLIHLAAWERSVVFFLQGKPRYEGLGVDEAVYLNRTDDEINAVIQPQWKDLPLAEALSQLRSTHEQLWTLLQPLTDMDLNRPYRHYLPDEPVEGDGPPAIDVIYGNTAHHFAEHLVWIESLAG